MRRFNDVGQVAEVVSLQDTPGTHRVPRLLFAQRSDALGHALKGARHTPNRVVDLSATVNRDDHLVAPLDHVRGEHLEQQAGRQQGDLYWNFAQQLTQRPQVLMHQRFPA